MTTSMERVVSRPRSTRLVISSVQVTAFSVAPSRNPRACCLPLSSMPSATRMMCSPKWIPSIISTASFSAPSGCARCSSTRADVAATKRRLTALLLVPRDLTPIGSSDRSYFLVATPISICS